MMNEGVVEQLENLIGILDTGVPNHARKVRLKENVEYIVSVVAVQNDKVLLMQESKASCAGTWYLPAGRMKKNETIIEAAKRETLEETGLEVEVESLILVEASYCRRWMRFTFSGLVKGGSLKTEADKESMAANWFHYPSEVQKLPIRCTDMFHLIEVGMDWYKRKEALGDDRIFKSVPVLKSHSCMSVKVIIVSTQTAEILENEVKRAAGTKPKSSSPAGELSGLQDLNISDDQNLQILLQCSTRAEKHTLPLHVLEREENFQDGVRAALQSCGVTDTPSYVRGIIAVEHSGDSRHDADGLCLTYLVELRGPVQLSGNDLEWFTLRDVTLIHSITELLKPKMCINCKER